MISRKITIDLLDDEIFLESSNGFELLLQVLHQVGWLDEDGNLLPHGVEPVSHFILPSKEAEGAVIDFSKKPTARRLSIDGSGLWRKPCRCGQTIRHNFTNL